FIVPFAPFGEPVVERSFSPWHRNFIRALSFAGGADQTFTGNAPVDELALSTPQDNYWNDQHGGPRDPQPGNVPAVQIDFGGNVDLGLGCPCNPGDAIAVEGDINAATPLSPTAIDNAEFAPGKIISAGLAIVFTYLVTDPGTQSLTITSIRDDNGTP